MISHVKTKQMYLTVYNMQKFMMQEGMMREGTEWRDPLRVVLVVQTSIPNLHSYKKFQNSAIDT